MNATATPWDALLRNTRRVVFAPPAEEAKGETKAGKVRRLLRERGPLTAAEICMEVDIASTALVMPVLKHDLTRGAIVQNAGRDEWNPAFDEQLQADISQAVALLKRNGYEVRRPQA